MSIDHSFHKPEISVIIPHFEQCDALILCLDSLKGQTLEKGRFEVIVVDNCSSCDLSGVILRYPGFKFITENNRGAANARNTGMVAAAGNAFAFIDADCIADPAWLESGLRALEASDLVGGDIIVTTSNSKRPTPVEAFERVFAFHQRKYIKRKHFSVTANLFVTRNAATAIGEFHNGISEDVDWCQRARALGFRLAFNDRSIISHPARQSWEDLTKKWDRLILERWNGFEGRSQIRRIGWASLAVATALSAVPHVIAVMFCKRVKGARNRAVAAGVLARIRFWRARRMLAML